MYSQVDNTTDAIFCNTLDNMISRVNSAAGTVRVFSIEIEQIFQCPNTMAFDILNMLNTLMTINNLGTETVPKIMVLVNASTPLDHVKQLIKFGCIIGCSAHSGFTKEDYLDCVRRVQNGVYALHPKLVEYMRQRCIQGQRKGAVYLTPRESQIMQMIKTRGASNKVIALTLGISESTVKLHVGHLLKKYSVKNRTQLAAFCTCPPNVNPTAA